MRLRTIAALFVIAVAAAGIVTVAVTRLASVRAQEGPPLLVLYWEEDFQGRSLEVTGSLPDLPVESDAFGNPFDWNDRVRSVIVVSGTWRLFQNGRCNTRLDDTPLEALDLRAKEPEAGWSCLVSATSRGPIELSSGAAGGFFHDVSSIELVSAENLPDWAAPALERRSQRR